MHEYSENLQARREHLQDCCHHPVSGGGTKQISTSSWSRLFCCLATKARRSREGITWLRNGWKAFLRRTRSGLDLVPIFMQALTYLLKITSSTTASCFKLLMNAPNLVLIYHIFPFCVSRYLLGGSTCIPDSLVLLSLQLASPNTASEAAIICR